MKLNTVFGGLVAAVVIAGAAHAQQDVLIDQNKLYVTDPKACQALENEGVSAFDNNDFLSMSFTDGIQGLEFNCNFFDIKTKDNSTSVLVEAFCQYPGETYPDLLAISPYDEQSITVTSLYGQNQGQFTDFGDSEEEGTLEEDATNETADEADTAEVENLGPGVTHYYRCENLSELPR